MYRLGSRILTTVSVGLALLFVAASSSAAATRHRTDVSGAGVGSISWGSCSDPSLSQAGAQCGYLSVPLNYSKPNGQKIRLAVARSQHTSSAADYQGAILTNPGGLGAQGLSLGAILASTLQEENDPAAAADYDWIGFDPRGVGSSKPALSCNPGFLGPDRANYIPTTSRLLTYWKRRSQAYAAECAVKSPKQTALLHNDTTIDSARDMDSIRKALGLKQISYYGFSYGTYLGQVYSTLFPSHVRRLILDFNVDPRGVWYQSKPRSGHGVQPQHQYLVRACRPSTTASTTWAQPSRPSRSCSTRRRSALRRCPAGGVVGPDEWNDIFQQPADYERTWLDSAQLFARSGPRSARQFRAGSISAIRAVTPPGTTTSWRVTWPSNARMHRGSSRSAGSSQTTGRCIAPLCS